MESTPSSTPSAVTPSSSASGRSATRCRRVGRASALTSSGVTKSRPDSHAHALLVASSAVEPRGDTPSCSDGEERVARQTSTTYPSTSGDTDDLAHRGAAGGELGRPGDGLQGRQVAGVEPGVVRGQHPHLVVALGQRAR